MQESNHTGEQEYRRAGIQNSRNAGERQCRRAVIQERNNAGEQQCRKRVMQESSKAEEQQRRKAGMQESSQWRNFISGARRQDVVESPPPPLRFNVECFYSIVNHQIQRVRAAHRSEYIEHLVLSAS